MMGFMSGAVPTMRTWELTQKMKFNVYGRFQVEVRRENDCWIVYRLEQGKRGKMNDVVIPNDLEENEIATYLDDIFHELAGLGQRVERLGDPKLN